MALVVDTGPLFAALDRNDLDHQACREALESEWPNLVVPSPVLVELDYLIRTRLHSEVHVEFLRQLAIDAFRVIDLAHSDYLRIHELCVKYNDQDLGLVDASVVAIAERLNEPKIATLDHRNFSIIEPRHVKRLQLLPRLTRSRPRRKLGS